MTKKEAFIIARALSGTFYKYRRVTEVQLAINEFIAQVGKELKNQELVDLYTTALALTLQHGDQSGQLNSIQMGTKTYP